MINNIHRWLLIRLALVWLILSLISGSLVHYIGHARLEDHVANMAKSEIETYVVEFVAYVKDPTPQTLTLFKQRLDAKIEKDNLLSVIFFDTGLQKITESSKPSSKQTEMWFSPLQPSFSDFKKEAYEKITDGANRYLRISFPIENRGKTPVGYFFGIYREPADIIAQMEHQSFWSLGLVILVILATSLALYPLIIRLNTRLSNYSHILALTNVGMLKVLGSAIAKRDSDTNIHNYRVTLYSVRLGEEIGISNVAMQGLIKGAFLHDVGKIAISDSILLKPGKLTNEEFEVMKTHVRHGDDIISGYPWLLDAKDVVLYHHEKFDGSGYPAQTAGEDIPLNARIFAIADVFDALTSKRPYKGPFDLTTSVNIIKESQGSHFDPAIVELFLKHAEVLYDEICFDDEGLLHGKLEASIYTYFEKLSA